MRFTPLCSESMGVRSLCVYVETNDVKILLDAGVALGQRFYLTPHPLEYEALRDARAKIREYASKADAVTISHYHFDHYTATWKDLDAKWSWSSYDEAAKIYGGKTVYAKDFRSGINYSQRKRGYIFGKMTADFVKEIVYCDSTTYQVGETELRFTEPLSHGEEDSALGYVVAVDIVCGEEKLSFYPDVQGPVSEKTLSKILEAKPQTLIIGGPPLYLSGWQIEERSIKQGLSSLKKVVEEVPLTLLDHHILRSDEGLAETSALREYAEKTGNTVRTFAEHVGLENRLLEARRRQLFEDYPPTPEFRKWMNLNPLRQKVQPQPL